MSWFEKNREWLITVGVLSIFILLLTLSGFYFKKDKNEVVETPKIEDEVEIDLNDENAQTTQNNSQKSSHKQTSSFFLRPSPDELISKLENLDYHEFTKESKDLPGLRIMWPLYFFSVVSTEDEKAQVMFDAKEDGFGVIVVVEINIVQYPQIWSIKRGQKLWIAGEITGVDPEGTGRFFVRAEYVRFSERDTPETSPKPSEAEKDGNDNT